MINLITLEVLSTVVQSSFPSQAGVQFVNRLINSAPMSKVSKMCWSHKIVTAHDYIGSTY